MAGRVRWRAGSGGGQGDRRGMDLWSKECSGVNIVTYHILPPTKDTLLYIGKVHFYVGKKHHAV